MEGIFLSLERMEICIWIVQRRRKDERAKGRLACLLKPVTWVPLSHSALGRSCTFDKALWRLRDRIPSALALEVPQMSLQLNWPREMDIVDGVFTLPQTMKRVLRLTPECWETNSYLLPVSYVQIIEYFEFKVSRIYHFPLDARCGVM